MADYRQVRFDIKDCTETITDLLAAFLVEVGYESFVPDDNGLTAFIVNNDFCVNDIDDIIQCFPIETEIEYTNEFIQGKDWNEEWEKHYFKPIVIGDQCVVRSSFHKDVPAAKYEIIIDPKMAFGTGHHSTTSLIIQFLLGENLTGKTVIDMGTGTGILAILCALSGASNSIGIEIDSDACENAKENVLLNHLASKIEILHGDASLLSSEVMADLFIANINRNIILSDLPRYAMAVRPGGIAIFSGFYEEDIPLIERVAKSYNLDIEDVKTENSWTALKFCKK